MNRGPNERSKIVQSRPQPRTATSLDQAREAFIKLESKHIGVEDPARDRHLKVIRKCRSPSAGQAQPDYGPSALAKRLGFVFPRSLADEREQLVGVIGNPVTCQR